MTRRLRPALLAVMLALAGPAIVTASEPATAQGSDSYQFIKAVKDRDVTKARGFVDSPGAHIVDTRDGDSGLTALGLVTRDRDIPWMGFLLKEGADVNGRDRNGQTPLIIAADQRFLDGARLLIEVGADVNAVDRQGVSALIRAVQLHDVEMVRLLVEQGASPDKPDSIAGLTARDYANQDKHSSMIARILDEAKPTTAAAQGKPGDRLGLGAASGFSLAPPKPVPQSGAAAPPKR